MIADTLRHFDFECCDHIPLLFEMYRWGQRHYDLDVQCRARNRLVELGAITVRPNLRLVYDADQLDYAEEADAHGVTVRDLLR
jgi:hypothetical protein